MNVVEETKIDVDSNMKGNAEVQCTMLTLDNVAASIGDTSNE